MAIGERLGEATRLREIIETQRLINAATLDPDHVMAVVTERAQMMTGASAGVVELLQDDEMVYRAASGTASPNVNMRLKAGNSLSGMCVRTREVLVCRDSETDPRVDLDACRRVGARSMIVVPLVEHGQALGVLKVMSPEPDAFTDDDVSSLEVLAGFIATSLSNAAAHRHESERALQDGLTGLPNRLLLEDRLGHALRSAKRRNAPLAVFFIDLDGFKAVNDTHGHAVGDGLLSLVAAFLRASMRASDTVARLGGDEFVVVCEDMAPAAEPEIRARIDAAVARAASAIGSEGIVTASIGLAWSCEERNSPAHLLERADESMYEVKRARRASR
jgi:diguanylate cyclase (GGDEF)-like protein